MTRGTILWVDLADASPPELGKRRPGLVVSNSAQNAVLDSVVIIPLSSRPPEIWPLRVALRLAGRKRSFAVIPGIRQVSKRRLLNRIASLDAADLHAVDDAIKAYLAD